MMTATFQAYQGTDREELFGALVDCPDLSHIGAPRASVEINQVECDAYFSGHTTAAVVACNRASLKTLWKLKSTR